MTDSAPTSRLLSLDALRGADILIIAGLDTLVYRITPLFPHSGVMQGLRAQMGHVAWDGLTVYDMVFPLFVFLSGVSLCLSQHRRAGQSAWRQLGHLWWRAALLVFLGWAVNGAVSFELHSMRFASVLGLIGLSGAAAGTIALLWGKRAWCCTLTAALLLLGIGTAQQLGGDFTPQGCLNARIDALLCPGRLHLSSLDPEGPLCIVSATALCLCGYAAGSVLLHPRLRTRLALLLGAAALCLGFSLPLPCIKNIWTSGFTLTAAGAGFTLLAIFHLLTDTLPPATRVFALWAMPLRVAGSNALFLYLFSHLFNLQALAERLSCGLWSALLPAAALPAAYAGTALLLAFLPALWLYRRRIFLHL